MVIIPVTIFLIATGIYLGALNEYLADAVGPLVAQVAGPPIHREMRIGRIDLLGFPGRVIVKDVEISNHATFADDKDGHSFLKVRWLQVHYNIRKLLADRSNVPGAIGNIELDGVTAYAERKNLVDWNFSDLIPKEFREKKVYSGVVSARDATLYFRDRSASYGLPKQIHRIDNVWVNVDCRSPHFFLFSGSGDSASKLFESGSVSGALLRNPAGPALMDKEHGFRLRVRIHHGDAKFLAADFIPMIENKLRVTEGDVDVDVNVTKSGGDSPVDVQGFVHLDHGAAIDCQHMLLAHALTGLNGDLYFTLHQATLALTGSADGMPVSLDGGIFGFPSADLDLRIALPTVPVARLNTILTVVPRLPAHVSVPLPAAVAVLVTGSVTEPIVRINAAAPTVVVQGCPLSDIHAEGTYTHGLLALNSVTAKATPSGGTLALSGLIATDSSPCSFVVRGTAKAVPIADLNAVKGVEQQVGAVSGLADGQFVASSGWPVPRGLKIVRKWAGPNVTVGPIGAQMSIDISHGMLRNYSIPRLALRAYYTEGVGVTVPELVVQDARGGTLLVRGTIPMITHAPARYDLRIQAARIQFGALLASFGLSDVRGTGYFHGTATGPLTSPNLEGRISLVDFRYQREAIDLANGNIRVHNGNVGFDNLQVHIEAALATFTGYISDAMSQTPHFSVRVGVNRIQLSYLLGLLPDDITASMKSPAMVRLMKTATGSINGEINAVGTPAAPMLSGDLTIANATVDAYRFQDIRGSFDFDGNVVHVKQITASWEDAQLKAIGSYNFATKQVASTFTGNGLDAERIGRLLDPDMVASGTISVAGSAHGLVTDPTVAVQTVTDRIKIGAFTLEAVRAAAQYEHGVISSTGVPIVLSLAGAKYTISRYRFDPQKRAILLIASVADQRLSVLLDHIESTGAIMARLSTKAAIVLRQLPSPLDAEVSIPNIAISGTLDNPTVTLAANLKNVVFGSNSLDDVNVDFDYGNSKLTLRSLTARSRVASVSASGTMDLAGGINAKLEASNVDLSLLAPLMPPTMRVGGVVSNLTVVAAGKTMAPDITASVTLDRLSYGSIMLDRVESGNITIANRQLSIDGLTAVMDEAMPKGGVVEHVATIRGSIPFAWKSSSGTPTPDFPSNVPIDVQASIPEQSLSVLSMFVPALKESSFSGMFRADVNVSGTLADKKLSGEIAVVHGQVKPPGMQTGLKNIDALISLNGNNATIERATADSLQKNGGSLSASGTVTFLGARPEAAKSFVDAMLGGVSLDIIAKADGFKVAESKIRAYGNAGISGQIDGQIHVTRIATAPLVAGSIRVTNGSLSLPNVEPTEAGAYTPPPINPHFDVGVAIASGARIESPQVKLYDASGDFHLLGSMDVPNLHGRVVIQSGVFDLPTARFRVQPGGTADVAYNPATPNDPNGLTVTVNLEARTSMSISQRTLNASSGLSSSMSATPSLLGNSTGSDHYTVTAEITGTLKSDGTGLHLEFSSDPPLAESQIMDALGGQSVRDIGTGNVDTGVRSLFAQVLSNQLGTSVFESVYDVTGLDINVDYNPDLPFTISLTKRLLPRVEATFTRLGTARSAGAVSSTVNPPQYQLLLGYNLNNRLSLILSADDQRNYAAGIEGVFRF